MKHKQHFRRFLSSLLLLAVSTLSWAYDFEVDGICYNVDGSGATVTSGLKKYAGNYAIPSTVSHNNVTYNVTGIGNQAFFNCTFLTSITIPESVTSIGDMAFNGCSRLASVSVPQSVTSIGDRAFSGCPSLTSVSVESGNKVYDSRDNSNAIIKTSTNTLVAGCKSTVIPQSVTSIGGSAFQGCPDLTSITIPEGVTDIGRSAFIACTGLTTIIIPNSVKAIGGYVFYNCPALTSVTIPEGVTAIGDFSFYNCSSLSSFTIPESVTSIGAGAFSNCSGLTSITISENVTDIGNDAFSNCSGLTSLTIPNGVKSIGSRAFFGCSKLTSFICAAEGVPATKGNAFANVPQVSVTLYVPASALNDYKKAAPWKKFGTIQPIDAAVLHQ